MGSPWTRGLMAAASLLMTASGPLLASEATGILAGAPGKARVLLVLASQAADPKIARQRALFKAMGDEARDRDLRLVEVIGDTPEAARLRKRFAVADHGFRAILIGKDGGDKLMSDDPLEASALFPLIDAMPMRQDEMRRRP